MEEVLATEGGRLRAMFSWDDTYTVADGSVLQDVVEEHAERQGYGTEQVDGDRWMTVTEDDAPLQRLHRYRVGDDGSIASGLDVYTADLDSAAAITPSQEYGRHRTMTRHRFDALVGRANMVAALAGYLEDCHEYGVLDPVLDLYQEGPVLDRGWVEERVLKAHGPDRVDEIAAEAPTLFDRVDIAAAPSRDTAVDRISREATPLDDISLDLECCTRGREMASFYADDAAMQSIYGTVLAAAVDTADIPYTGDDVSI